MPLSRSPYGRHSYTTASSRLEPFTLPPQAQHESARGLPAHCMICARAHEKQKRSCALTRSRAQHHDSSVNAMLATAVQDRTRAERTHQVVKAAHRIKGSFGVNAYAT